MVEALLHAIVADPQNEDRYLVLADWLEEHDDPRRAELLRQHRRLLATCCEPEKHPERADWQASIVALLAEGVRPCVPTRSVVLGEGVEISFAFIPPGSFLMGSPDGEAGRRDDEVLHQVTLTHGFWLGVFPMTRVQWQAAMCSNSGWCYQGDRPVDEVSWKDCQELCERTGKRFRLPTEAEWEYACRAGTTTPFFFGETILTGQANYADTHTDRKGEEEVYRPPTTPAGNFPPNAWGLFDMHGNVSEWCQDWYGRYPKKGRKDPAGRENGPGRVLRGGSFEHRLDECRSAYRGWSVPELCLGFWGCRLVLRPDD